MRLFVRELQNMAGVSYTNFCACIVILVCTLQTSNSMETEDVHLSYAVPISIVHKQYQTVVLSLDNKLARYRREAHSPSNVTQSSDINGLSDAVTTSDFFHQDLSTAVNTTSSSLTSISTPAPKQSITTATASKPSSIPPVSTTLASTIIQDNHNYYMSKIVPDASMDYYTELVTPNTQNTLNAGHRVAVTVQLPFNFRFYGHNITNITVATGGFIYVSPFLHQWLTATQYIAPLMANFDTSIGSESSIYYKSVGDEFIIEWKQVVLKDQNETGLFTFQAKLKAEGTITFVYKTLPIPVVNISKANHPVKIGLSDAFYIDSFIREYGIKRRTIYEYHRVSFSPDQVEEGTVIILEPLPTCNLLEDCVSCTLHKNIKFDCKWCDKLYRCSDGIDWYRQDWLEGGCSRSVTESVEQCVMGNYTTSTPLQTSTAITTQPSITQTLAASPSTAQTLTASPSTTQTLNTTSVYGNATLMMQQDCSDKASDKHQCPAKNATTPVAAIVVIVLILVALIAGFGIWFFYAYTHPTSASGIWLMEHRPGQMKSKIANIMFWKSSTAAGTKYAVESTA